MSEKTRKRQEKLKFLKKNNKAKLPTGKVIMQVGHQGTRMLHHTPGMKAQITGRSTLQLSSNRLTRRNGATICRMILKAFFRTFRAHLLLRVRVTPQSLWCRSFRIHQMKLNKLTITTNNKSFNLKMRLPYSRTVLLAHQLQLLLRKTSKIFKIFKDQTIPRQPGWIRNHSSSSRSNLCETKTTNHIKQAVDRTDQEGRIVSQARSEAELTAGSTLGTLRCLIRRVRHSYSKTLTASVVNTVDTRVSQMNEQIHQIVQCRVQSKARIYKSMKCNSTIMLSKHQQVRPMKRRETITQLQIQNKSSNWLRRTRTTPIMMLLTPSNTSSLTRSKQSTCIRNRRHHRASGTLQLLRVKPKACSHLAALLRISNNSFRKLTITSRAGTSLTLTAKSTWSRVPTATTTIQVSQRQRLQRAQAAMWNHIILLELHRNNANKALPLLRRQRSCQPGRATMIDPLTQALQSDQVQSRTTVHPT